VEEGDARMNRPESVGRLLNAFGVASDKPLGSGQESDVFAIDGRRVLRLYRRPCDERHLARLATFYARLDRCDAPFMVPEIIELGERRNDGRPTVPNSRMPGGQTPPRSRVVAESPAITAKLYTFILIPRCPLMADERHYHHDNRRAIAISSLKGSWIHSTESGPRCP
jgi:hypothetical protein